MEVIKKQVESYQYEEEGAVGIEDENDEKNIDEEGELKYKVVDKVLDKAVNDKETFEISQKEDFNKMLIDKKELENDVLKEDFNKMLIDKKELENTALKEKMSKNKSLLKILNFIIQKNKVKLITDGYIGIKDYDVYWDENKRCNHLPENFKEDINILLKTIDSEYRTIAYYSSSLLCFKSNYDELCNSKKNELENKNKILNSILHSKKMLDFNKKEYVFINKDNHDDLFKFKYAAHIYKFDAKHIPSGKKIIIEKIPEGGFIIGTEKSIEKYKKYKNSCIIL